MADTKPLKISYCTTCKGRLHHLKQTLPANMAAEKNNPNVEFVVLDYGSEDGLAAWIKQNFQAEMDSGRLRYARYESPHFKMAHAKNMAHRVATGDVLCNVDADNFIAQDFSQWLEKKFQNNPDMVLSHLPMSVGHLIADEVRIPILRRIHKMTMEEAYDRRVGLFGRIALSKKNFYNMNGYDESFSGWGGDDYNMVQRARAAGLKIKDYPTKMYGAAISHDDASRVENLSPKDKEPSTQLLQKDAVAKSKVIPAAVRRSHSMAERAKHKFERIVARIKKFDEIVPIDSNYCDEGGTVTINCAAEPTVYPPMAKLAKPSVAANAPAETERKLRPREDVFEPRTDWAASVEREIALPTPHWQR